MTAEEINELITDIGIDRVIADLSTRGYFVRQLVSQTPLDANLMVVGKIALLDAHGLPQHGIRVKVETLRLPQTQTVNSIEYQVSLVNTSSWYETNTAGVLDLNLVKGSKVRIHIENTFTRELIVPQDNFNVLSYASDDHDAFVTPRKPYAGGIRRA